MKVFESKLTFGRSAKLVEMDIGNDDIHIREIPKRKRNQTTYSSTIQ